MSGLEASCSSFCHSVDMESGAWVLGNVLHLMSSRYVRASSRDPKALGISNPPGGNTRLKIRPAGSGGQPFCRHKRERDGRSMRMNAMRSSSFIGEPLWITALPRGGIW